MEEIRRQVTGARRRLAFEQSLAVAPWCLFVTLLAAAIAVAIPKIWFLGLNVNTWTVGWVAGALAVAGLTAIIWTYIARRGMMDAAIEIDHRFGLKERVSSALALTDAEQETEVGRALIHDASRRVEVLAIKERFSVAANWRALLPLVPALVVFVLAAFVPDAERDTANAAVDSAELRTRIKKSTEEMRKRMAQRRKNAEQQGLEEAEELFKKIQQGLDDLAGDKKVDHKKALVKINDMAKEIEKRRSVLGDSEKMKQQFNRLKNIEKGPAERLSKALKDGDLQKAIEQLKQLADKMKSGELSEEDQQKLADQLKQMKQKLEEMVEAHKEAKQELERQIKQKESEGDLKAAGKLQRKLDRLEQQDAQMERLDRMAQQLQKSAESMENGQPEDAASQLAEMASELQDMEAELDELATLDEMMDEIADAKAAMREGEMNDMYSSLDGAMDQFGDMSNDGLGQGEGFGYRPEEETETGEYEARERAKPKAGEAVRIGDADGPNRSGITLEGVKQQIITALNNEADPLTDQRLPKMQQDHVREYYQRLGQGE